MKKNTKSSSYEKHRLRSMCLSLGLSCVRVCWKKPQDCDLYFQDDMRSLLDMKWMLKTFVQQMLFVSRRNLYWREANDDGIKYFGGLSST